MINLETKSAAAKDQVVPTKYEPSTTAKKTSAVGSRVVTCGNGEVEYKEKKDNICWATYD